jgi:enoyl-CoA hydratase/carnithine racemase
LGLVNRVAASGHALTQALALAEQLNGRAPNALASIKTLITAASDSTLTAQLDREREHFVRNLHHANAGIGIAAFLSKETPIFK